MSIIQLYTSVKCTPLKISLRLNVQIYWSPKKPELKGSLHILPKDVLVVPRYWCKLLGNIRKSMHNLFTQQTTLA
jgi:hypothetical protein